MLYVKRRLNIGFRRRLIMFGHDEALMLPLR